MPTFNREQIRERMAQLQNRVIPLSTPITGLEDLHGQLGLRVLSTASTLDTKKQATANPELSEEEQAAHAGALSIARSLVLFDSRERIFSDEDTSLILELPLVVFNNLATTIARESGLSKEAVETAKNA